MATRVSADQARETAEAAREQEWKLPSFGKELFLGHLRLDLIYPQPPIDTEARRRGEAFLAKFGDFLAREVDPGEIEREAKIPDRVTDGLKSIGALGMKIEERYGGLGLSQLYYSRALSLSGNYHSAIPTLLSAHQSIGVPEPLRLFGTEEQKEKWLPLVARTHLSAFMLTEPDAGSDPARPRRRPFRPVTGAATWSRGRSCGGPTAPWPTSWWSWPPSLRARDTGAASRPSSSRPTARA